VALADQLGVSLVGNGSCNRCRGADLQDLRLPSMGGVMRGLPAWTSVPIMVLVVAHELNSEGRHARCTHAKSARALGPRFRGDTKRRGEAAEASRAGALRFLFVSVL